MSASASISPRSRGLAPEATPGGALEREARQNLWIPLARLRRRWRLYLAIEGLFHVCIALLLAALLQMLLDRTLRLALEQRAALNVAITLFWLAVIYRALVRRLRLPLDERFLASSVDRAHPALCDLLATTVQFARGGVGAPDSNSRRLVADVVRDGCRAASRLRFLNLLDHRRAARRTTLIAGFVGLAVLAFGLAPNLMRSWFLRNWLLREIPWPQRTHIVPEGFDAAGVRRVPLGDEFTLRARIRGVVPTAATLLWQRGGGAHGRTALVRVGADVLESPLGPIQEDVRFRITGGDERTREYVLHAVARPRVVHTIARVTYPDYTGQEPAIFEQQTVLNILAGAGLELEARLNKPVQSAAFARRHEETGLPCELLDPQRVRVRVAEPQSGTFCFRLVDRDGWENTRPVDFVLDVQADLPPVVRSEPRGVGEFVTPEARFDLALAVEDLYGLGAVRLLLEKEGESPQELSLPDFVAGKRRYQKIVPVALAGVSAAPGDAVNLWATAADQDPRGPNEAASARLSLRVLSRDDFLAELARRELEYRQEFERLVSSQRAVQDGLTRLLASVPAGQPVTAQQAQRLRALERQQRASAGRCERLADQFAQILVEMRVNQVARAEDERRLADRISTPLRELGSAEIPAAADALAVLYDNAGAGSPGQEGARNEPRRAAVEAQASVLRAMRAILSNMLEWEGYREAVALLQEIITDQRELRGATLEALERQLEAILGPGEAEVPASAPAPRP